MKNFVNLKRKLWKREQKRLQPYEPEFRIEGNNGGDYLIIRPLGDNRVYLEVGSCCVCSIHHVVPIELLTNLLDNTYAKGGFSFETTLHESGWPGGFVEKLISQIKNKRGY